MSFTLDVPVLDANPVLIAELRPSKINEFIERLPLNNVFSAATILLEEMQILNRQKISADSRIKALELYRPSVIRLTSALQDLLTTNETYPMPAKLKSCFSSAELLWQELAYGYKLACLDYKAKLITRSTKSAVLASQRAVHSLHQLALVYYSTYYSPPTSIWADLHQLYYSALQQKTDKTEVSDTNSQRNNASSVRAAYSQAMLIGMANPQHLTQSDIKLANDYLCHLSDLALLRSLAVTESHSGVFLIKLDSNQLPIPFNKNSHQPNINSDILLVTIDIARKMHQDLQILKEGKIPADGYFPSNTLNLNYVDLITYLIKQLGATPKRLFSRASQDNKVQLLFGVSAAFQALEASTQNLVKTSIWQVQNTSATGFALKKFQAVEVNIKVGDFIAMKETDDGIWSVGVLRWIIADEQDHVDIGFQLLTPTMQAISLKSDKLFNYENALLLPELVALKVAQSIVVSRGIYQHGAVFDMMQGSTQHKVLVTKLLERTPSFERFEFSII